MSQTKFNLDDIQEANRIQEEGTYLLNVVSFDEVTTAGGTLVHKFKCVSEDGASINADLYITENAMWKYKLFIKACGHPGTGVIDVRDVSPKCVGRQFKGEIRKQKPRIDAMGRIDESKRYYEVTQFFPLDK